MHPDAVRAMFGRATCVVRGCTAKHAVSALSNISLAHDAGVELLLFRVFRRIVEN